MCSISKSTVSIVDTYCRAVRRADTIDPSFKRITWMAFNATINPLYFEGIFNNEEELPCESKMLLGRCFRPDVEDWLNSGTFSSTTNKRKVLSKHKPLSCSVSTLVQLSGLLLSLSRHVELNQRNVSTIVFSASW